MTKPSDERDDSPGNGWTGGQYSLYRVVLGGYLTLHFCHLMPWSAEMFSNIGVIPDAGDSPLIDLFPNVLALSDGPGFVLGLLIVATIASLSLAIGWFDRTAAVVIFYIWACLLGRNLLITNPSIPFIGWLLLAHVFLPKAPYGSWMARGRIDPDGGWRLPQPIHRVAWIVMSVSYTYSGYSKLESASWIDGSALHRLLSDNLLVRPSLVQEALLAFPSSGLMALTWFALAFELLFAPLALFRRVRPWLWLGMLLMHLSLIVLIDFADLSFGMVILHLFTFDPRWVRPLGVDQKATLFYDGTCGLCHRCVRFVLAEDHTGDSCDLVPLQDESLRRVVSDPDALPDSIVVRRADGTLLVRSAAVLFLLHRLGGCWRVLATPLGWVPKAVLDVGYRGIARIRRRLFKTPEGLCPVIPPHLRGRFP